MQNCAYIFCMVIYVFPKFPECCKGDINCAKTHINTEHEKISLIVMTNTIIDPCWKKLIKKKITESY